MVVNVLQLSVCIHLKPMGGNAAPLLNALEIATLVLTTYINFGSLNINAALVSKDLAVLQGRFPDALLLDDRIQQIQTTMQASHRLSRDAVESPVYCTPCGQIQRSVADVRQLTSLCTRRI